MYFHKRPEGFPFVYLREYEDALSMVNMVSKDYEGLKSYEIKRSDGAQKTLGRLGNPTLDEF